MIEAIWDCLSKMGYEINRMPYAVLDQCDDWYKARCTEGHKRTNINGAGYEVARMGFGRRMAADDANLCEVVEINAGGDNDAQFEAVNDILRDNRFDTQYRKQLELTAAEGTAACYVWLEGADMYDDGTTRGGRIRLEYVDALGFIPLTVENGDVIEAAFAGEHVKDSRKTYTLVVCTRDEAGRYSYRVRRFNEHGELVHSEDAMLGTVKPFAVLRTAQVNTFDDMQGFGYPKLYDVIPLLMALDMAFTALTGDIDTSEKITLINESLCRFDDSGNPITPNEQMKRRFVLLGEKLPQESDVIHEIVPEIRVDKFRETIELLLNMLSQQFGYGSKKYSFDKSTGALMTATQYIGERQDMLQELNKQRFCAREYIANICRAIMWFDNTYRGAAWDEDVQVLVEFDDSYITNKAEQLESMRADIVSGIGGAYVRQQYLMAKYNLDESEAAKWAAAPDEVDETED